MNIPENMCQPPEYTAEEIDDMFEEEKSRALRINTVFEIIGDDYDLDRLRELVEADRDGRCVVLPCKLNDKLFYVENGEVKEAEVNSFHHWISGCWKMQVRTSRISKYWMGYEVDFDGIGKTVFLTREAAEAALRKERHD